MLAADQFCNCIDLVGGERDDRGAARLPRDLSVAGKFELRQPRPGDDVGAGQQPLDDRPHRRGAEQQRLVTAAAMQDAVGEDKTALQIGRDLDFIDGQERHVEIARHGFDGRDPEARLRRLDLLLAGNQRDGVWTRAIDDLVVDLARQEPQRQSDDAGGMRKHPLDRQMRLAGVGRPKHRSHASTADPKVLSPSPRVHQQELRIESGTEIMVLLVPLVFEVRVKNLPQRRANFGNQVRAPGARSPCEYDNGGILMRFGR